MLVSLVLVCSVQAARKNADKLGIDPNRIATAGGSAGGHIAASIGTLKGLGGDERPNAMILFNPGKHLKQTTKEMDAFLLKPGWLASFRERE